MFCAWRPSHRCLAPPLSQWGRGRLCIVQCTPSPKRGVSSRRRPPCCASWWTPASDTSPPPARLPDGLTCRVSDRPTGSPEAGEQGSRMPAAGQCAAHTCACALCLSACQAALALPQPTAAGKALCRAPGGGAARLLGGRRVLGGLVIAHAHEAREADADALARVDQARGRAVHRRDGQVGRLDLPHHARVKPHIRHQRLAVPAAAGPRIIGAIVLTLHRGVNIKQGDVLQQNSTLLRLSAAARWGARNPSDVLVRAVAPERSLTAALRAPTLTALTLDYGSHPFAPILWHQVPADAQWQASLPACCGVSRLGRQPQAPRRVRAAGRPRACSRPSAPGSPAPGAARTAAPAAPPRSRCRSWRWSAAPHRPPSTPPAGTSRTRPCACPCARARAALRSSARAQESAESQRSLGL